MLNGMLIWISVASSTAQVHLLISSLVQHTGLADISANYRVRENVTVFGRINNLFDTYYAEQSSVRYGHPGDWWPGQGRNFRLGVEVTI